MAYKQSFKKPSNKKTSAPKKPTALEKDLKKCEEFLEDLKNKTLAKKQDHALAISSALPTFVSALKEAGVSLTKVRLSNSSIFPMVTIALDTDLGEVLVGMDEVGTFYRAIGTVGAPYSSSEISIGLSIFRDEENGLVSQYIHGWELLSQEAAEEIRESGDGFGEWITPEEALKGGLAPSLDQKYEQLSSSFYNLTTTLTQLPLFLENAGLTCRRVTPLKEGIDSYLAFGHLDPGTFPLWDMDIKGEGVLICCYEQTPAQDPPGAINATLSFRKRKTSKEE